MNRVYSEMGSRNKKTGELVYYNVTINRHSQYSCECIGHSYRPYQDCKHIKRLKEKGIC